MSADWYMPFKHFKQNFITLYNKMSIAEYIGVGVGVKDPQFMKKFYEIAVSNCFNIVQHTFLHKGTKFHWHTIVSYLAIKDILKAIEQFAVKYFENRTFFCPLSDQLILGINQKVLNGFWKFKHQNLSFNKEKQNIAFLLRKQ